jgi:penicillin-binding protein 1A
LTTRILLGAVAVGFVAAGWFAADAWWTAQRLTLASGLQATQVLDKDDKPAWMLATERRVDRPLGELSPHLVSAVMASEDRRFYWHPGVDVRRIAGAAVANIRAGGIVEGGSTITQQLVRSLLGDRRRSWRRKMREIAVAWYVERRATKREILQTYLNTIYLGRGSYGVEVASRGYFGKPASDLAPAEAAALAGLIHAPEAYDFRDPRSVVRLTDRRDGILRAMVENGWLTGSDLDAALATPMSVTAETGARPNQQAGAYFLEAVRQELVRMFGSDAVLGEGLRVFTTADPRLQGLAEQTVARGVVELDRRRSRRSDDAAPIQAGLVVLDAASGEIRALVGGRGFRDTKFDHARHARRQPGSAFKPILYAAALEQGYGPGSMLDELERGVASLQGEYLPRDGVGVTRTNLRDALMRSNNRAAIHLFAEVGASSVVSQARRLGIESALPQVPSLALGSGEVTLLELTAAYLPFANGGWRHIPTLIRRVEDSAGQVLYQAAPEAIQVLRPTTAFLMTSMLSDVVNRGTGWAVRREGVEGPVAGKTGTTNGFRDAWFVGYSPDLVTGLWFGTDEPGQILAGGSAATVAAPYWGAFMASAQPSDAAARRFPSAKNLDRVEICHESGLRAHSGCFIAGRLGDQARERQTMVYREYFVGGTAPIDYCARHSPLGGWFLRSGGGD